MHHVSIFIFMGSLRAPASYLLFLAFVIFYLVLLYFLPFPLYFGRLSLVFCLRALVGKPCRCSSDIFLFIRPRSGLTTTQHTHTHTEKRKNVDKKGLVQ